MNRYLLFCGAVCYPRGGWRDFKGSMPIMPDVVNMDDTKWAQLVDTQTLQTFEWDNDKSEWVREVIA